MTPESVGWAKNSLVLGKHSGRAAFRDKLKTLGYQIGDNQLNDAFRRFKDLADRKKVVFDEDIVALVDDEVMRDHERIRFVSLDLHAGSKGPPRAEMELEVDGVVKSPPRAATARWTRRSRRSSRSSRTPRTSCCSQSAR